ncbi:hypothetical protein, partial [Comamonas sp. SCN 67-35]|uniref:hypothetical protein n=1 Tax=Comamonas sp. SCN 67-35 TaxID=1660096 RepID=UPI0025BF905E
WPESERKISRILQHVGSANSNFVRESVLDMILRRGFPNASGHTNKELYDYVILATAPNSDLRSRWLIYKGLWKQDNQFCS